MEKPNPNDCMLCYKKKAERKDYPRVTEGYGDPESSVLFLTHQPRYGCCNVSVNRPLARREIDLLDSALSTYGASMNQFYTINIVKCFAPTIKLPMFRNCYSTHTEEIIKDPQFKYIIGLGPIVAKYVFSRGKAPPSIDVLCGRPVQMFDMKGKILFFVRHPGALLNMEDAEDDEFIKLYEQSMGDYRALAQFLKDRGEIDG